MALTPLALTLALVTAAPRGPMFERPPPPLDEAPEPERSSVELVASAGAAMPESRGAAPAGEVPAGTELAVLGLYRPSPYFACGAVLRFNALRLSSAAEPSDDRDVFAGAVGRLYFRESGAWEPYLELDLGVSDRAESRWAARSALGIDLWLGAHTRLGPSFAYTRYADRSFFPKGLLSLVLSLTVSTGATL